MDPQDMLLIAARASIVYFFVLFVVRILGKREIGNVGAFDLVVTLIISESVDEVIYGDVSMVKGFILIGTIGIWHLITSYASFKNKTIEKLTEAQPRQVIKDGEFLRQNMAKERLNEAEILSQLRLMEVDSINEVKSATVEPNGQISAIKAEWAKEVQKKDIGIESER